MESYASVLIALRGHMDRLKSQKQALELAFTQRRDDHIQTIVNFLCQVYCSDDTVVMTLMRAVAIGRNHETLFSVQEDQVFSVINHGTPHSSVLLETKSGARLSYQDYFTEGDVLYFKASFIMDRFAEQLQQEVTPRLSDDTHKIRFHVVQRETTLKLIAFLESPMDGPLVMSDDPMYQRTCKIRELYYCLRDYDDMHRLGVLDKIDWNSFERFVEGAIDVT